MGIANESWPMLRLGDLCKKIGSGATPRGGGESYLENGPFTLIRSQNVYNDGFKVDGLARISEDQALKLEGVSVQENDVLLNITGDSVARTCIAPKDYLPARVNQHVAIIRTNPEKLDARFLRYFLISPKQQAYLLGMAAIGATRNALTKGMIENLLVPCPNINEQKAIATILGTLDDKIELNRKMNATLEAMAQAIFKSWFVDFDPVLAKAEGRKPSGMDAATAALFPDSFQNSALGKIPKGWEVCALYDCAGYINGLAFRNDDFSPERFGLPVIKIGELKDGVTSQTKFTEVIREQKYLISSGNILFSWSGSPDTSIDTFIWTGENGWLNQHIFKIQIKRPLEKLFVYFLLRHLKSVFIEIARNKQTTGLGHVTVQDLKRLKTVFPPDDVLRVFNHAVEPLFEKAYTNRCETRTLADIRDLLLPKLLSGEIRVGNPKNVVRHKQTTGRV
ncbi:MAG: restriction endonuclease subunit S [Nitrospirae bacterium]|nr:restriction endonuclease subunit S [Nitrospirota bacterium]MBI3351507.1 restriction endonuclease subunit S [Nitrospirota bacterium]